ncbi:hypothetical protein [Synechococcus sp. M16CYN]|uniref:hypothetical protein n=1 Tax=Synechococcus sp. M16CYN TaxID=3103139 RepID=UPI00333E9EB7
MTVLTSSKDRDGETKTTSLHLQSMRWTSDGELDEADRIVLLDTLIPQCVPAAQIELIQTMERIALRQPALTAQVSEA